MNGLAEVVAAAFLLNDPLVDLAGGDVVVTRELAVQEAFVVAEVQIHLAAIVEDEDLAVLVRGERAGIYVTPPPGEVNPAGQPGGRGPSSPLPMLR